MVKDADIVDGLLVINLENIIPEEKKARKIEIGSKKTTDLLP
jgi:HSP20 family molecular chaperone IbpA